MCCAFACHSSTPFELKRWKTSGNTCHIYDILLVFGNALASKPGQATPWQAWQLRAPFQVQHAKTECGAAPVREVGWQELSLVMERM